MNTETQLWETYWADRSITNRNAIASVYYAYVQKVASNLTKKFPEFKREQCFDDAVSYGSEALLRCIELFDGSKGVKFTSYAYNRLVGALKDKLRNDARDAEELAIEYFDTETLEKLAPPILAGPPELLIEADDEAANKVIASALASRLLECCRNAHERKIIKLHIDGYSAYEINKKLKYKSNRAHYAIQEVTKRMKKEGIIKKES